MSDIDDVTSYLSEAKGYVRYAEDVLKELEGGHSTAARQMYASKYVAAMRHLTRLIAAHRAPGVIDVVAGSPLPSARWRTSSLWMRARHALSQANPSMDDDHAHEIFAADIIDASDGSAYRPMSGWSFGESSGI